MTSILEQGTYLTQVPDATVFSVDNCCPSDEFSLSSRQTKLTGTDLKCCICLFPTLSNSVVCRDAIYRQGLTRKTSPHAP